MARLVLLSRIDGYGFEHQHTTKLGKGPILPGHQFQAGRAAESYRFAGDESNAEVKLSFE